MLGAVYRDMITAKNKVTQQIDLERKVKDAYPLTMVTYAMVPTSGISLPGPESQRRGCHRLAQARTYPARRQVSVAERDWR